MRIITNPASPWVLIVDEHPEPRAEVDPETGDAYGAIVLDTITDETREQLIWLDHDDKTWEKRASRRLGDMHSRQQDGRITPWNLIRR